MTKAKLSPLPPNTVLNGYTIVRQVSEGGFSLVYLAVDPNKQMVAIKEYLPSSLASRSEGQLSPQVLPRLRMYKRDSQLDPWTDMYAIGACIYSMMLGYPPPEVVKRRDKDPVPELLMRRGTSYSDKLIEVVEWCMALGPLARPQSVFELQTALANYQAGN